MQDATDPFEPSLLLGSVAGVEPSSIRVNLSRAGRATSTIVHGARYGLGTVGEFVLIEGEGAALFGRIVETRLPERERLSVEDKIGKDVEVHAVGTVQLLATVSLSDLAVKPGVNTYPRIGARVYSAQHSFVSSIPLRSSGSEPSRLNLHLGAVSDAKNADVYITPERLFGRHCGILGATGGGKSYTVAKIVQECTAIGGKIILLDPSGEYHGLTDVLHVHLGKKPEAPKKSEECVVPYHEFTESDFVSLFQPAGKTQGPKLRAAIRTLRLAYLKPALAPHGVIIKADQIKKPILDAESDPKVSAELESPRAKFDVTQLARQIHEECIYESGKMECPRFHRHRV